MVYVQGSYNRVSDLKIEKLTDQQILDTINNKNVSQIFLKDFNFKDLLGDIRYNSRGEVVGAGAVEMKFYTTGTTQAKKYLAMVLKIFVTVNISGDQMSTPMLQVGQCQNISEAMAFYFCGINKIWGT